MLTMSLVLTAPLVSGQAAKPSASSTKSSAPISLSIARDGRAAVLEEAGAVVELDLTRGARLGVLYRVPPAYRAVDMTVRARGASPTACVSVYQSGGSQINAWLVQPGTSGSSTWAWLPGHRYYGGCAIDEANQIAVTVGMETGEVYAVQLGGIGWKLRGTATPARSLKLLAVAVHSNCRMALGDSDSGRLFMTAADGAIREVGRVDGEVRALAFNQAGDRLFVADSDKETIWMVPLRGNPPLMPVRYTQVDFREPSGVAVDPQDRVWVSDRRARTVVRLSPDGRTADMTVRW
jgi:hypothetical protein